MRIGILGTGVVGQTLAARLVEGEHTVAIGTRDPAATLARTQPDAMGNPPFAAWQGEHPAVSLGTFADAAGQSAIVITASNGSATLEVLRAAGEANLEGKPLLDISNPLDFSRGMPPSLFVSNTDSLAEQIQRAFPNVKVVKALNTTNARVMAYPRQLAEGDHTMFVCGNDAGAKAQVVDLLRQGFGWQDVLDLGDLTAARAMEMFLPLWLRLFGALQTPAFNIKVVR
jgi:predicted dinucleotide-binding enzyme